MSHLRRTLFIGLGGMGIQTILKTKAAVMDNYSIDGEMPPMIAFMGIDTDSNEYTRTAQSSKYGEIHLANREMMDIAIPHPHDFYESNRKEMGWLPPQNKSLISSLNRCAGQIRSNGRLSFIYNYRRIKDSLMRALVDITTLYEDDADGYSSPNDLPIEVNFVFSLCGGTGSGIFIDVAYLLQEVAAECHMKVLITAYAVMPGVYQTMIKSPVGLTHIFPNAYAALRELDYVMSASYDRTIKLPWTKREMDREPFDSVTLIDNKNEGNLVFPKSEDLAEMISTALLTNLGQVGSVVLSISDNIHNDWIMRVYDVENKRAWVSAIGVGALVYDAQRVARLYQLKAQNKLLEQVLNYSQDCDLLAHNWVDFVRIRENYGKDQLIEELYDMSVLTEMHLATGDFDRKNVNADVNRLANQYFEVLCPNSEEWSSKVDEIYDKVVKQLERKEDEIGETSIGLLADFLTRLQHIIRDDFMPEMSRERAELDDDRMSAKARLDACIDKLDIYMHRLIRLDASPYLQQVINSAFKYIEAEIESKRRLYALHFYEKLLSYIETRILRVKQDINTLQTIHSDNGGEICILRNMVSDSGRNTIVDLTEVPIRDMKVNEEEVVLSKWISMLSSHNLCHIEKEEVLATLEKYTSQLPQYIAYREFTIDDVLNQMSEDEAEDSLGRLINISRAFLQMDDMGYCTNNGTPIGDEVMYLGVPDAQTCRLTKDEAYRIIFPNPNVNVVNTGLADRIVVYRQKRPVPVFAIESLDKMKSYADRVISRVSPYIDENWYNAMEEECFSLLPKSLELSRNEPSSFLGEDSQTYV